MSGINAHQQMNERFQFFLQRPCSAIFRCCNVTWHVTCDGCDTARSTISCFAGYNTYYIILHNTYFAGDSMIIVMCCRIDDVILGWHFQYLDRRIGGVFAGISVLLVLFPVKLYFNTIIHTIDIENIDVETKLDNVTDFYYLFNMF